MKVNWSTELSDMDLRKIGIAMGKRSAKATRKEVRMWLGHTVMNALLDLPRPALKPVPAPDAPKKKTGLTLGSGVCRWKCPGCKNYVTCEIGRVCTDCKPRKDVTHGDSVESGSGDGTDLA